MRMVGHFLLSVLIYCKFSQFLDAPFHSKLFFDMFLSHETAAVRENYSTQGKQSYVYSSRCSKSL